MKSFSLIVRLFLMTDDIGHIVETDEMKEKVVNGRTSKLIDLTLEDTK